LLLVATSCITSPWSSDTRIFLFFHEEAHARLLLHGNVLFNQLYVKKVSISMPASTNVVSTKPMIQISYESILRERSRESKTYLYEVACSIIHLTASAHLSIRVTGEHTYRNAAGREIAFTRSEAGATTYIELLEAEQLEVRIVELEGGYSKALYSAHGQELTEQDIRGVLSTIERLDAGAEKE
jgi:hypothetical protein